MVPWIGGKQPQQITVVGCWHIEGVESLLFSVVLAKRLGEAVEGVDLLPTGEQRPLPGDFRLPSSTRRHIPASSVLAIRRNAIANSSGAGATGKRFGEIFIWMALRVPES